MNDISVYPHVRESEKSTKIHINEFLERIKNGYYQDAVEDVRERLSETNNRTERSEIKGNLPNATISGVFKTRHNGGLITHSGFIAIDVDHVKRMDEAVKILQQDKYTYSLFKSVSGEGLCIVIRIPTTDHKESFLALEEYYSDVYRINIDKSCKNVGRTRFISHDPDLYLNKDSESFTNKPTPSKQKTRTYTDVKVSASVIDQIIGDLESDQVDITHDYDEWLHIGFAFAEEFGEQGRDYFHRISRISDKYDQIKSDAKFDEFLKNKRGEVSIGTFFHICVQHNVEIPRTSDDDVFWFYSTKEKGISIDLVKFRNFLKFHGYCKLYYMPNKYMFCRKRDNVVEEVSLPVIKDFIFNHVKSMTGLILTHAAKNKVEYKYYPTQLLEFMIRTARSTFSVDRMEMLPSIQKTDFLSPYKDRNFFFFNNGFVHVNHATWKLFPYDRLEKYIWKDQIEPRELQLSEPIDDLGDCIFFKFISKTCDDNKKKINKLMSIIGYMLNDFPGGKRKAVILTDSNPDDAMQKGRTGKSLIAMGMSHLRVVTNINGKAFDYTKDFKYQGVNLSTQIINIDDLAPRFDINTLFSDITGKISVNLKNKQQFDVYAKFYITLNRLMRGVGDSFSDRFIEFQLSHYFNKDHSPINEYGHHFFDDWDSKEWAKFFNFMFHCCQRYFMNMKDKPVGDGISVFEDKELDEKKLVVNTSKDFCDFMFDCFEEKLYSDVPHNIALNREFDKMPFFEMFRDKFPTKIKISRNLFSRYLTFYGMHKGWMAVERRPGGVSKFAFYEKGHQEEEEDE